MGEPGPDIASRVKHHRDKKVEVRSALTRTIAGLYCLLCGIFGIVFPISDALAYNEDEPFALTQTFHLYLYIVSIAMFLYLLVSVFNVGLPRCLKSLRNRRQTYHTSSQADNRGFRPPGPGEISTLQSHRDTGHANQNLTEMPELAASLEPRKGSKLEEFVLEHKMRTKISYHGEGMNVYIRIGAAIFAAGSIVYKVMRIAEPFEHKHTGHCIHVFSIFVDAVFVVFVVMQTFLIFRHHQVVINRHKAAVRLCLMHLLATNLAVWVSSCAREIVEDLSEPEDAPAQLNTTPDTLNMTTEKISCRHPETLADKVAPYFFPCIIEYSLIGAAAIYRIYLNVAKPDAPSDNDINGNSGRQKVLRPPPITHHGHIDCGHAHIGLVLGVLLVLVTIGTVVAFYALNSHDQELIATYVFLVSDILLVLITLVSVICALIKMRALAFVDPEEDSFDDKLLIMSLGGFYFYSIFIILSSARSDESRALIGASFLVREALSLVQISVQTVMILDGFRRRADNDDHVDQKPGRGVVTFLLACNFALWIVNTFEIKRAEIGDLHADYFSKVAWRLLVHVSLPLVIFYRFHSTVCLSDIWEKAYEKEKEE